MRIREMMNDDIDFALNLTSIERWSDIKEDFEALLTYSPKAAFVMESPERYIGMISAVSYGTFGFIGSLIVHPSARGQGYGIQLLEYGIRYLESAGTEYIMLDAVPEAMALYERHGFRPVCKSFRLAGNVSGPLSDRVRDLSREDLPEVFEIDLDAFGADRSHFLSEKWMASPGFAVVLEVDNHIVAYAFGSHRKEFVTVAPWIATENIEINSTLLSEISKRSNNRKIAIGTLETSKAAYNTAVAMGMREYSYSIRMVRGDTQPSFMPSQYAIGSPAKG